MRSITAAAVLTLSYGAAAQTGPVPRTEPWKSSGALLILDPYEANDYDIARVASDPKVQAIIHQASQGSRVDRKFLARAAAARAAHLRFGAYHLGLKGDPKAQADLLVGLAQKSGAQFLALDIEDIGGNNMPLTNAEIFAKRVFEKTGRYPALYVNWSVATAIARTYGASSIFHSTPLWIARVVRTLPPLPRNTVWPDYTIWQFGSELNCPDAIRAQRKAALCEPSRPYVVPGVRYDMDVNVLNGGEVRLTELFGRRP